ncbi:hypothetical protein PLICRDRAFT_79276, partial [Plicaturopsis crispa FD-325 SS-3]
HREAYEKCRYIHRDVSGNNILISWRDGKPVGTLIDWEFARKAEDLEANGRQYSRSGTWQFMSCGLLQDPTKQHEIQDDMESFVHVVMYHSLR